MEFLVRDAAPSDVEQMVRLRARLFVDLAALGSATHPEAASLTGWAGHAADVIRRQLGDPEYRYVVAIRPGHAGDDVIGWGRACLVRQLPGPGFPTGWAGLLNSLVTDPGARGRGVGTAVAQRLLDWLAASGAEVVDVLASKGSVGLLTGLGFAEPRSTALRWTRVTATESDEVAR